jgi:hypothetical protein
MDVSDQVDAVGGGDGDVGERGVRGGGRGEEEQGGDRDEEGAEHALHNDGA